MKPHAKYIKFWEHFYTSRRIAQLVVSWALERRQDAFATFIKSFTSRVDIFGHTYTEDDLWNSVRGESMVYFWQALTYTNTATRNSSSHERRA